MRSPILACVLLAACVEERDPPTRFVGTIDGERPLVFVVRDPSLTSAYACDGTVSPALFEWFAGDSATQLSLTSDAGTATIEVDFDTGLGTLMAAGTSRDFALKAVDAELGLYRGTETDGDDTYEVGIVLLDERTQNGVIGITTAGSPDTTVIVSPRIEPRQTSIRLLNDVSIRIETALNAYVR